MDSIDFKLNRDLSDSLSDRKYSVKFYAGWQKCPACDAKDIDKDIDCVACANHRIINIGTGLPPGYK